MHVPASWRIALRIIRASDPAWHTRLAYRGLTCMLMHVTSRVAQSRLGRPHGNAATQAVPRAAHATPWLRATALSHTLLPDSRAPSKALLRVCCSCTSSTLAARLALARRRRASTRGAPRPPPVVPRTQVASSALHLAACVAAAAQQPPPVAASSAASAYVTIAAASAAWHCRVVRAC